MTVVEFFKVLLICMGIGVILEGFIVIVSFRSIIKELVNMEKEEIKRLREDERN